MKAFIKVCLSVSVSGALVFGSSAMAATKAKTVGYHCVNNKGIELKAASKASQCKLPYHWIKASPATAAAKTKAKGLASAKKRRGSIATTEKKTISQ